MSPELSIFDKRYKRCALGLHRADRPTAMILGERELADELERLCDELAQEKQKTALLLELRAATKERIEELAGSVRVLSRVIHDSLDASDCAGAALSPRTPANGRQEPAAAQTASHEAPEQSCAGSSISDAKPSAPQAEPSVTGEVAGPNPAPRTINAGQLSALRDVIALIDKGECVGLTEHEERLVDTLREVAHA